MGYMMVAVFCENMSQGRFRTAQFFFGKFPEQGTNAPEIIVLMSMYEMDMDYLP